MPFAVTVSNAARLAGALNQRHWSQEDELSEDLGLSRVQIDAAVAAIRRRGIRLIARDGLYMIDPDSWEAAKDFARRGAMEAIHKG